ncbi:MAG: hypothetical protein WCD45_00610 [Gallionella sp.]
MKLSRVFLPLWFALALLFTQQAGATHALHHALEQHDKQSTHTSAACEQCENYAQLGSALTTPAQQFLSASNCTDNVARIDFSFRTFSVFAANARAPPSLQKSA